MVSMLKDRSRNIMDGGYVNAPDYHNKGTGKDIGLREYNSNVLVHNWFEERTPFEKKEYPKNSSYRTDYKPFPDAKPDTVLRKQMIKTNDGLASKHLIGMHNFDSSKNMITLYDETINRRPRPPPLVPVGQQFPDKRSWRIINDSWIPEKIDYPLQDTPTRWGLVDQLKKKAELDNDKYKTQLPELSEYQERYKKHSTEAYLQRNQTGIPKNISTSLYDINKTLNHQTKPRQTSSSLRQPQARDVMDTVYESMLARSERAPRTYYYLGKIPTNGALDVFSMKEFETLTPVHNPSTNPSAYQPKNDAQETKPARQVTICDSAAAKVRLAAEAAAAKTAEPVAESN